MQDFYSGDESFGFDDGFMLAAGVVGFENTGPVSANEDPSIGKLEFFYLYFAPDMDSNNRFQHDVKTRPCTTADFNDEEGTNDDSYFFKSEQGSYHWLETYATQMQCLEEPEALEIWGNNLVYNQKLLSVSFVACNNATSSVVCKSEEEIERWMQHKYILLLHN